MSVLSEIDKITASFAAELDKILSTLEKRVIANVSKLEGPSGFDATALLNSAPSLIQALKDAGFDDLVAKHVESYEKVIDAINAEFKADALANPKFSTANITQFQQIAESDMAMFSAIGENAINTLKNELYQHAIAGRSIDAMIESIAAAIGPDSPLARYSYTYANTAILNFAGNATITAGESIGADKWEVVGPNDQVTRPKCQHALGIKIDTKENWIKRNYWGGTPGGWNCRHSLFPYFGDAK